MAEHTSKVASDYGGLNSNVFSALVRVVIDLVHKSGKSKKPFSKEDLEAAVLQFIANEGLTQTDVPTILAKLEAVLRKDAAILKKKGGFWCESLYLNKDKVFPDAPTTPEMRHLVDVAIDLVSQKGSMSAYTLWKHLKREYVYWTKRRLPTEFLTTFDTMVGNGNNGGGRLEIRRKGTQKTYVFNAAPKAAGRSKPSEFTRAEVAHVLAEIVAEMAPEHPAGKLPSNEAWRGVVLRVRERTGNEKFKVDFRHKGAITNIAKARHGLKIHRVKKGSTETRYYYIDESPVAQIQQALAGLIEIVRPLNGDQEVVVQLEMDEAGVQMDPKVPVQIGDEVPVTGKAKVKNIFIRSSTAAVVLLLLAALAMAAM